jgi:hypothetical protein
MESHRYASTTPTNENGACFTPHPLSLPVVPNSCPTCSYLDTADDEYPDKPPRMRWATYNRLMGKLVAADGVADERLVLLAARES